MKKKKFITTALGCRTNQYEAQAIHDQLESLGMSRAAPGEKADICVVNTCTVTASADSSSRHEIRRLIRENPGAEVVVTGCFADSHPDQVKSIEGVSHLVPNKSKEELIQTLFPDLDTYPEFEIQRFDAHTRAFLKVQDGCNSFCTYCIIPYVRGRSRSRRLDEIVGEAKSLLKNGFKEIVLTGINIGDFDGAPKEGEEPATLADLVRAIDPLPGLERLRISSIDPDEVDDDLLAAVMEGKKTSPSMHIVLQSGSNVVLKRMNRKYTRQMFFDTVQRLKNSCPDFTFTTDIIVGFPGETEQDFEETLDVMNEVAFSKVHMFPYSDRPRTRANLYPNKVPKKVIQERKNRLLERAERMSYQLRNQYVGRRMKVLTESVVKDDPTLISGHTDNFLEVVFPKEGYTNNEIVEVELIRNLPHALEGRVVS